MSAQPSRPVPKGKASKKAARRNPNSRVPLQNARSRIQEETYSHIADLLLDPGAGELLTFPGITPSRAHTARFPLVREFKGLSDFGIVVSPELDEPLKITHGTVIDESNTRISGTGTLSYHLVPPVNGAGALTGDQRCSVEPDLVDGLLSLPVSSTAGGTLNVNVSLVSSSFAAVVEFWLYDIVAGSWGLAGSTPDPVGQGYYQQSTIIGAPITSNHSAYTFRLSPNVPGDSGHIQITYALDPVAATVISCQGRTAAAAGPAVDETVMDVFRPDLSSLLTSATRATVSAMDCLVSYVGSQLNSEGAIAVCNADPDLRVSGSFYETAASRPFDKYDGPVLEGGHWHYVPSDPSQLILHDLGTNAWSKDRLPTGYFGIKGMDPSQPVRVEVNMLITFYSEDPSYAMKIQPIVEDYLLMLYFLRVHIPLCTSNDSHVLKKIKKGAKGAVRWASNNPDKIRDAAIKGFTTLAPLLL